MFGFNRTSLFVMSLLVLAPAACGTTRSEGPRGGNIPMLRSVASASDNPRTEWLGAMPDSKAASLGSLNLAYLDDSFARESHRADAVSDAAPLAPLALTDSQTQRADSDAPDSALARASRERRAIEALDRLSAVMEIVDEPRGKRLTLSSDELFDPGSAELVSQAHYHLDEIAEAAKNLDDRTLVIEAHTDSFGSPEANVLLSQRRAEAVRDYLVSKGAPGERIRATGLGAKKPIADNTTPRGRSQNRRIDVLFERASAKEGP